MPVVVIEAQDRLEKVTKHLESCDALMGLAQENLEHASVDPGRVITGISFIISEIISEIDAIRDYLGKVECHNLDAVGIPKEGGTQ